MTERQQLWARLTEEFKVDVILHQRLALSPFLFAIIVNKLTEDISKDAQWDMLFADEIVLSWQNHRELEDDLEIWRNALERRGLKVVVVWQGIYDPGQTQQKDGDRGFILLPPQPVVLPRSDAGSDRVEPAPCIVIQNCQTYYTSRCPMCGIC